MDGPIKIIYAHFPPRDQNIVKDFENLKQTIHIFLSTTETWIQSTNIGATGDRYSNITLLPIAAEFCII